MVIISNPRQFAPLMAKSSFKRKIIGAGARALHAIPVIRPQDLAVKGDGTLTASGTQQILGTNTNFKQQVHPRDLLSISKTIKLEVSEVVSDTELKLKAPLNEEALEILKGGAAFKIVPHIDQGILFEKVHDRLEESKCIVIFPEGGSHDRPEMLPIKAGFAIMALGAMAEKEGLNVKIVPVGLNYFHPHRFRSRAVVSYGAPISIDQELVEKYKKGGLAKREAISTLIGAGYDGLRSVTVNAPSYDTLMIIAAARRLYKPIASHKLRIDQVVELNRRFLIGYKHFENDPRLIEISHRVKAYNNTLKYFGLRDHQVERTSTPTISAAGLLTKRILMLLLLSIIGFPALLFNYPIVLVSSIISAKKQKEALAGSNVKIAARDVLATWKVLVVLVFAPTLYGFYSFLLFGYLYYNMSKSFASSLGISIAVWCIQPFLQYAGVRLLESGVDMYKSLSPLIMCIKNPDAAAHLRTMRDQLSDYITNFVNENGPSVFEDFDTHKFEKLDKKEKDASWRKRALFDMRGISSGVIKSWFDDRSLFNFSGHSDDSEEDAA
ncbi:hypothetical protein CLU79DRAFT_764445 [Phycomyces nitens]|nr:hypothetical protein CLU79DRAFT_764445 [Phycomyces nitens]